MSGLSDHLRSGRAGAPVGCGGGAAAQAEGKAAALGGLEELWSRELELQEGPQDPESRDGLALVTPDFISSSSSSSPSALSNGLHLQRRPGHGSCRRRDSEGFPASLGNMQTPPPEPDVRAQAISHSQACAPVDFDAHAGCVAPEGSRTPAAEGVQTTCSSRTPSLALGNHTGPSSQAAAPAAITTTSEVDMASTFCPVPGDPNQGSASPPAEAEKKYALRSSGRPRFPCHLRKSSRLRRGTDDGEKKAGQERVGEEEVKVLEEKIWRIKEEAAAAAAVAVKEEPPLAEAPPQIAPCPADIAQSHAPTPPKNLPKAVTKPGPRLGHRPGPKSRSRPALKPVHKAAPKSVLKRRQAAQAMTQLSLANTTSISAPAATVKQEPVADLGASSNNRRRGRFVGVSLIFSHFLQTPCSESSTQTAIY